MIGLLALVLAIVAATVTASPAKADLYRYWSAWQLQSNAWQFLDSAPSAVIPGEGAVVGWRYAVGGVDGSTMRAPRGTPSFDEICGSTTASDGQKLVGVVVDPGTEADAPDGQEPPKASVHCAQVDSSASVEQALQAVEPTRIEGGLVCAIDDYPSSGCGDTVTGAMAAPADTDVDLQAFEAAVAETTADGGSSSGFGSPLLFLLLGFAVVVAAVVVVVSKTRSQRDSKDQ